MRSAANAATIRGGCRLDCNDLADDAETTVSTSPLPGRGHMRTARQDPALPPSAEGWCTAAGRWLAQAAAEGRATVAELLHLGSNPLINAAVIATAPLVLLMHATMPALTNSAQSAVPSTTPSAVYCP